MRFAGLACTLLLSSCSLERRDAGGLAPERGPDLQKFEPVPSRKIGTVRSIVREVDHGFSAVRQSQHLNGFGSLSVTLARGTIAPVFCDTLTFQRDAFGAPISPGADVSLSYEDAGVLVSALEYESLAPGVPIAFDSSSPTGADLDLGTPNEIYGGPGVGCGGASNDRALGNLLIKAENTCDANGDGIIDDPDDDANGAWLVFEFAEEKCVARADLVDLEDAERPARVRFYGPQDTFISEIELGGLGDNSVEHASFDVCGVHKLKFGLQASGALHDVVVCNEPEPNVDVSFDVDLNNLVAFEFDVTVSLDDGNSLTQVNRTRTSIDPARAIRGGSGISAIPVATNALVPAGTYGSLRVEIDGVEAIGVDGTRMSLPGGISKTLDHAVEVGECGSTHVAADWTLDARIEGDLFGIGIGLSLDNAISQRDLSGCP